MKNDEARGITTFMVRVASAAARGAAHPRLPARAAAPNAMEMTALDIESSSPIFFALMRSVFDRAALVERNEHGAAPRGGAPAIFPLTRPRARAQAWPPAWQGAER